MPRGFTLVELSIVLVIIGLLIGGILVVQSMIQTARVTAQIAQIQQFDIATTAFKQNFKQIPGDSTFFSPPGNNNGRLFTNMAYHGQSSQERDDFFGHLEQAEFLDEGYGQNYNRYVSPGSPYPKAEISAKPNFGIAIIDNMAGTVFYFLGVSAVNGNTNANFGTTTMNPTGIMSPQQAFAIDSKMDDGHPADGNIVISGASCTNHTPANFPWATGHCYAEGGIPYPMSNYFAGDCMKDDDPDWRNYSYDLSTSTDDNECRLLVKANIY